MNERVYRRKGEFAFRVVAGEAVLVPIRQGVAELNSIFSLNEVGAAIWSQLEAPRSCREISAAIVQEFEVSREDAERSVDSFLGQLEAKGLVQADTPAADHR